MNVRKGALYSFSIKNIFYDKYDKMDLRLLVFMWRFVYYQYELYFCI